MEAADANADASLYTPHAHRHAPRSRGPALMVIGSAEVTCVCALTLWVALWIQLAALWMQSVALSTPERDRHPRLAHRATATRLLVRLTQTPARCIYVGLISGGRCSWMNVTSSRRRPRSLLVWRQGLRFLYGRNSSHGVGLRSNERPCSTSLCYDVPSDARSRLAPSRPSDCIRSHVFVCRLSKEKVCVSLPLQIEHDSGISCRQCRMHEMSIYDTGVGNGIRAITRISIPFPVCLLGNRTQLARGRVNKMRVSASPAEPQQQRQQRMDVFSLSALGPSESESESAER